MKVNNTYFYLFLFLCVSFSSVSQEKPPINLAVSNALSGPASQLGRRLNQGADAYFSTVNKRGGIHGARVNLILKDDSYEPYKTVKNTQEFLRRADIFAFINYVGTPTTHAILPLIKDSNIPFLMPFTGAEFLRNPVVSNIFNARASYYQEAEQQIKFLVNDKKIKKIGLLVQADEFGTSVERGYLKALKSYGLTPTVTTRYRRNTSDISLALSILQSKNVEAIAFVGTYEPFARLINLSHEQNFHPFFSTVSFISSQDLFSRLHQPSNVLVTEVMPDIDSCTSKFCHQFRQDMKAKGFDYVDRVQFEGYINAYIFTRAAQRCDGALTRSCFVEQMKHIDLSLSKTELSFSDNDHQGSNEVFFNLLTKEKYEKSRRN